MVLPDFQSLMLPILEFAAKCGKETTTTATIEFLAEQLQLTAEERKQMLPSGTQFTFNNRVGWAITYMKKAQLLSSPRRGYYQITDRGRELLNQKPSSINTKTLEQYPEFLSFIRKTPKTNHNQERSQTTPLEDLEAAYKKLRDELAEEVLSKLKETSPSRFESIVVELLVKMGYGGSLADAGQAIGRSHDGGIDGIIKEDRLGLDVIYIQAKRWKEGSVGSPEVMKFAGALAGQQANKGIFITTSTFTPEARSYVSKVGSKIVLIDGEQLANLMIDYEVGVSTQSSYPVKKLDQDYYEEG